MRPRQEVVEKSARIMLASKAVRKMTLKIGHDLMKAFVRKHRGRRSSPVVDWGMHRASLPSGSNGGLGMLPCLARNVFVATEPPQSQASKALRNRLSAISEN